MCDDRVVSFLRDLIRIPSLPGQESDVATRVLTEMEELGYDEVTRDEAGNVIGRVSGSAGGPSVMFNTHLDHVEPGTRSDWSYGPFDGEVVNGKVWGRGAVDIKGPLAAQVHAGARLLEDANRPLGDVWVTSVVQEEVGGLGARYLAEHFDDWPDLVVVGEASSNGLRRGHRGRAELELRIDGESVHASVPARGVNPVHVMCDVLGELEECELSTHSELGRASIAITQVRTRGDSTNVVPPSAVLVCDCRLVPGQGAREISDIIEVILRDGASPGRTKGSVTIPSSSHTSYTGLEMEFPANTPAFVLPRNHPALVCAQRILSEYRGAEVPVDVWDFASDGGHFAERGWTVIGLAPGDESLAHTTNEHIELEELRDAVELYSRLAQRWPRDMNATRIT